MRAIESKFLGFLGRRIQAPFTSTTYLRRPFEVDNLMSVQVLAQNDHPELLLELLQKLKGFGINLTCLETQKTNEVEGKPGGVKFKLTFEKIPDNKYKSLETILEQESVQVLPLDTYDIPEVPWFPRTEKDIRDMDGNIMNVTDEINKDHPQFTDKEYRKRRDFIAQVSRSHKFGDLIPLVGYTEQENKTWIKIYKRLKEVHEGVMSKRFIANLNKVEKALGYNHKIPELRDIDAYLRAETGFRIKAASGILDQRDFLNSLGHRIFSCTQYIRHHAMPEYTPEPDIVHELVGHVPMFADREVADLSQQIGILSCGAESNQVARLGSLYWFTVEYGSHLEDGIPRAYGAGIASSIGECEVSYLNNPKNYHKAKFEPFNPFIHADTKYPIQTYQPMFPYTETFEKSLSLVLRFGETLQKPFKSYYDFKANQMKSDRLIRAK